MRNENLSTTGSNLIQSTTGECYLKKCGGGAVEQNKLNKFRRKVQNHGTSCVAVGSYSIRPAKMVFKKASDVVANSVGEAPRL
jgi:hypothetical protein